MRVMYIEPGSVTGPGALIRMNLDDLERLLIIMEESSALADNPTSPQWTALLRNLRLARDLTAQATYIMQETQQ